MRIAELFAGIGGVTSGFSDAGGFEPVFLNDVDPVARRAFLHNFEHLEDVYHFGSVANVSGPQLLELAGGEIDGLLGCPPCQGFSAVGPRKKRDERNALISEMRRLILSTKPKFFVLENVPALLNSRYFRDFHESLATRYAIAADVVNAAEFGVPQLRRRAVVIGFRRDLGVNPTLPKPQYGGSGRVFDYAHGRHVALGKREACIALGLRHEAAEAPRGLVLLGDALDDLPDAGCESYEPLPYRHAPRTPYQRKMRRAVAASVRNHVAWGHSADLVRRLAKVPPGECPSSHGSRRRNETYFSQAYGRLHANGLARTITTNFHNPGSGRFTHYRQSRALTVREALRIQGFPDTFTFGSDVTQSEAERLIGNAFPRPFARAIGRHVLTLLS